MHDCLESSDGAFGIFCDDRVQEARIESRVWRSACLFRGRGYVREATEGKRFRSAPVFRPMAVGLGLHTYFTASLAAELNDCEVKPNAHGGETRTPSRTQFRP